MPNEHPLHPLILPCETTETNYSYNVGGEVKKTVPFTKELREWLLSFKAIGIRFVDTLSELRQFTKHESKQAMCVYENGALYQFNNVIGDDDGENFIRPNNVASTSAGRWVKKLTFGEPPPPLVLWNEMLYIGEWDGGGGISPISTEDVTFYVDYANGIDGEPNNGTEDYPFKTVEYAVNTFGVSLGYWRAKLTIVLLSNYTATIKLYNFKNCLLVIEQGFNTIQAMELYNNGKIYVFGELDQSSLPSVITSIKSDHNEYLSFLKNGVGVFESTNDNFITMQNCRYMTRILVENCKKMNIIGVNPYNAGGVFDISMSTLFAKFCQGEIEAYNCIITRQVTPNIAGDFNTINP